MTNWAEREVKIACEREKRNSREYGDICYGVACYNSALKAYKSLLEDDHSGFSWNITKNILVRLMEGKPLTPIEDTEDVWTEVSWLSKVRGTTMYQCKRLSSLFKKVYSDDTVTYYDTDRVLCVDKENVRNTWHNRFVNRIVSESCPIEFPYVPLDVPIRAYVEESLCNPKNGDFDTMVIYYAQVPGREARIDINRYFKEGDNGEWVEIAESQWRSRIAKKRADEK